MDRLNATLKTERAKISGEICDIKTYDGRSYLYFSIKDGVDQSTAKCFMWKRDFVISGVTLKEGMEVIISATPNIYKPNGGLTLQVEMIEPVGEGALQKAYEELKKKLEAEGLFSPARKRELPAYPQRIGVVTSRSGAVINDFLSNIGKFGYEILFVDSKVEGQDAVKDLLSAVNTMRSKEVDVLVMMRGGGSLESFLAFNNETLVRALVDFPVPVVTGIGHDKDISLVAMASDRNVSTPTAVANLLNETWNSALLQVRLSEEKIFSRFGRILDVFRGAENSILGAVVRIESAIRRWRDDILRKEKDMLRSFELLVSHTRDFLSQSGKSLDLSSPERLLQRGYSIVRHGGKVLRSVKDSKKGERLAITLSDGTIQSQII